MSWAQITMQASSSEEDMNAMQAHRPRQNTDRRPIIMIASPHPTVLTGNYDSQVQMGASLMPPPPGSPLHSTSSATMFMTGSSAPPTNIPVQPTPSGNLVLTADIQMTSPSTTLLQSFPAGSKVQGRMSPTTQRSPSPSRKGSGFALFHADMESQDSNSRSSGSLTALGIADFNGTQTQTKKKSRRRSSGSVKRRSSRQDDALAKAFVEALSKACTPAGSPSASSLASSRSGSATSLNQLLGTGATRRPSKKQMRTQATRRRSSLRGNQRRASHTDDALAQALVASIAGTSSPTAGGLGATPSLTAVLSSTSTGALSPLSPPQQGAGQMNLVLNLPNNPDPALNTLTFTIFQDPNAARRR
ncbi:uncharacterized protein LOC119392834 [Rhipicephalus sanguineus]|uniref:uncharacterized protein LOC119392834 n=1 Tax=Rhipicephalus sanguineus TaxID=34632 RepID=UPI00189487CB|nr:uncharacterized protein LOC119392834 [Rhipicephalus sanguineus]